MANEEYKVSLEVFEGPLDLLLYLIKKDELDIFNIPIEHVTKQYMAYIDMFKMLDLNVAGEFVVMAATLMMIKSRMLLPVEDRPELEDEEDDPRWDLVRQLVEYKKFKDAAAQLQTLEERQENVFPRLPGKIEFTPEAAPVRSDVGIFDLLNAVNSVLKRFQDKLAGSREIYEDKWTVSEKIEFVLKTLTERGSVRFSELFETAANRAEVVCTFLALLELIRLKQLACAQPEPFAEIEISKAVASAAPSEMAAPTSEAEVDNEVKSAPLATEPIAAKTEEEEVEDEFDDDDDDGDGDDEAENSDQKPK